MANERETATKKRLEKNKNIGSPMFWFGIVIIILSIIWFMLGTSGPDVDSVRGMAIISYVGAGIGGLLVIIGAILFLIGKGQEKKQKNQIVLL